MQKNTNYQLLKILTLSAVTVLIAFAWQGNKGFNLWDEGFLWYGAQRVMLGEVPLRDFMAYDPGRYYWSAAIMSAIGNSGIMSLRASVAAFQTLGLFVGLLLIARTSKSHNKSTFIFLLLSSVILVLWMFPRHKLFDISLSIFLIGALTFLVERPTSRRYLLTGACVGLVAFFGRNHGMYGAVGSLGVMAWLSIKRADGFGFFRGGLLWAAGVVVGFAPMFIMALVIPGFAVAFWEGIRLLFELKTTNLPLPVPWPWKADFSVAATGDAIRELLIGSFFIGTVIFGVLSILWVVLQKIKDKPVPPALVASAFLALPYAQYAFSRADVGHLAQGIFPLLVGCLTLISIQPPKYKWLLALLLGLTSFWVMFIFHPGWQCLTGKQCTNMEISGSSLQIDLGTANDIILLKKLASDYAPNDQNFIVAPFWPGAYSLLERRSPMWTIYALWPRSVAFQNKEIDQIKAAKVKFVFVFDFPLDGRDDLRFKNTYPLIYQYIQDNFSRLLDSPNPAYEIYKAKEEVH